MNSSIKEKIIISISTCFKLGFFPFAPGTVGSLFALLFIPIIITFNNITSIIFFSVITSLGIWAAHNYAYNTKEDPSEVIIDEFIGMLLTIYIVKLFFEVSLFVTIISLIVFRIFDILKPWPINFCDKNIKGGLGIMVDDLIAAFFAGISVSIILKLAL